MPGNYLKPFPYKATTPREDGISPEELVKCERCPTLFGKLAVTGPLCSSCRAADQKSQAALAIELAFEAGITGDVKRAEQIEAAFQAGQEEKKAPESERSFGRSFKTFT